MAVTPTYPGVYIEELPSPVHAIAGVATSIAAFVGYTPRGIDNRAEVIFSFADFERLFGGLASDSELSYAVQQFFQNGGTQAYIVRVPRNGASAADVEFDSLKFTALSSGTWANGELVIDVDLQNVNLTADSQAFNLTVTNLLDGTSESFPHVTLNNAAPNYYETVINDPDTGSQLVKVSGTAAGDVTATGIVGAKLAIADVNTAAGDTSTPPNAKDDFALVLKQTDPAPAASSPLHDGIAVTVVAKNSPIPQSLAGLALQLQQKINAALAANSLSDASVRCSVTQAANGDPVLAVNAWLPQAPDAVIEFDKPAAGLDAAATLGLGSTATLTTINVAHYALGTGSAAIHEQSASTAGSDGNGLPHTSDIVGDEGTFTGIYALEKVALFNLLSIPDATRAAPIGSSTLDANVDPVAIYSAAITLCDGQKAFLLVDPPPNVKTPAGAVDWISDKLGITDPNGAAFFPRLRLPDPVNNYNLRTFAPSGVVAGVYATSDAASGVWTAPAGIQATLRGVQSMVYQLSDQENGQLNPLGMNCFRHFPVIGSVLWGARTLAGADALTSQWKYVPVRRTALFLEQSLYGGTQWVVFQPNDERLWAAIRLNVGSFMQSLFLKGAFAGQTPDHAYFVKCDSETTTPTDIDNGVVNILVGFAPLEPAEFVVIQIEQLTGQAQA